jgi:predicted CoA-substrate-specific enzyme activase
VQLKLYLGIDVGSVSTKTAVLDDNKKLVCHAYLPTQGNPISALQHILGHIENLLSEEVNICGVATTGSARYLAGVVVGADLVKNEITTQATAAINYMPQVQTVIEIGGQDSKIIIIRNGSVTDFSMNTVCAAGTGSFLDHQAQRLNITIDQFSILASQSTRAINISGKCTIFAESDMIHKQQTGHPNEGIIFGLCQALVRNYLNDVGLGKDIAPPILFQGGVAFNEGIIRAFKEELHSDIVIPVHREIMGAIGAALLVKEEMDHHKSRFKGFNIKEKNYENSLFDCDGCPCLCQISQLSLDGCVLASWGGQCNQWQETIKV